MLRKRKCLAGFLLAGCPALAGGPFRPEEREAPGVVANDSGHDEAQVRNSA